MRPFRTVVALAGLVAILAPASAHAQLSGPTAYTPDELAALSANLGSVLRFRQLGDTATLPKGRVEVGVQFASAPIDDPNGSYNHTRFVGRVGVGDRVDLGAWGGYNSQMKDGMAGVDARIALFRQGPSMPVSVSIRPSFSSLLGTADIWAGTVGADVTVSRTFGAFSPYAGLAATSSLATERLSDIDFDKTTAGATLGYVGVSYSWQSLVAAVEMEKGTRVSYAVRLGARF